MRSSWWKLRRTTYAMLFLSAVMIAVNAKAIAETTVPGSTSVSLNVVEAIEVTWPESEIVLDSAAVPGVPIVYGPLTITVKCNTSWGIKISSDDPSGLMSEFDLTTMSYVTSGKQLKNPVQWGKTASGPWTSLNDIATSVYSFQPKTGDTGSSVDLYLRVVPSYNDSLLSDQRDYRITVNYTAGVGY